MTGSDRIFAFGAPALSALLFVGIRPVFDGWFGPGASGSLAFGIFAGLAVVAVSYVLLRRALGASHRSFQLVFFGGTVGRLFIFAAAVAVAFVTPGLDGRAVAVALLMAFLPLTVLEVVCVVRGHAERRRAGEKRDE